MAGRRHFGASALSTDPLSRWVLAGIAAVAVGICLLQNPGLIEFDSKLAILETPLTFIRDSLHLWFTKDSGGYVALANGYLFPMAPFFALTHALHIPVWVAERLWLAALLTVGCWGIVRLCEAMGIGNRWARVLGGVCYCAAPLVVNWTILSAYLLPMLLLPWALVPLVRASRGGSPRRAAALSGIAVLFMGGVNAAVVIAVLVGPAVWLLTRSPGPRRRALMGWWVVAMVLACFWWAIPALLAGHYAFNFLPYTDKAVTITKTVSLLATLNGTSYWTQYVHSAPSFRPGTTVLVSSPVVIVATAVTAAIGLAGLTRRIGERLFLGITLAIGLVLVASGFSGPLGGAFSHPIQQLLQNQLTVLRNVGKFEPLVVLPLSIGLVGVVSEPPWGEIGARARARIPGARARIPGARARIPGAWVRIAVGVLAVAAVAVTAIPFFQGNAYGSGGFAAIPGYWQDAGSWLNSHQGISNTLQVPGTETSADTYTWGRPKDQPLQVVANGSSMWLKTGVLGSQGYAQFLTTVEQVLDSGTVNTGLAQYLARAGVRYVVESNDLNRKVAGGPAPAAVHELLTQTPGLAQVASFGPYQSAAQVGASPLAYYGTSSAPRLRALEIFEVTGAPGTVQTASTEDPVVVSGDVGSLLQLSAANVLSGRATVLAGDPKSVGAASAADATWAITDGNQRRLEDFGSIRGNLSYLLGPDQSLPGQVAGVPLKYTVVDGVDHETVASPAGAKAVAASSYGSSPLASDPTQGPAAVFTNGLDTPWVANATNRSIGQWVSITFRHKISVDDITITPLVGGATQPVVTSVVVTTDNGSIRHRMPSAKVQAASIGNGAITLKTRPGKTSFVRVEIAGSKGGSPHVGAGFVHIAIPGVTFSPGMELPDDEASAFTGSTRNAPVISFSRTLDNVNQNSGFLATDDPNMNRKFTVPKTMTATMGGQAVPLANANLEALLEQVAPQTGEVQTTASSWYGTLPAFRPDNLVETTSRPWIAGLGDEQPTVTLTWPTVTSIDSVDLGLTDQASRPTKISISSPAGSTGDLAVPAAGGVVSFPAIDTNTITIHFLSSARRKVTGPIGATTWSPVGLASISVPALAAAPAPGLPMAQPVALPCGQGPSVIIDGRTVATTVTGTVGDLVDFTPLTVTACLPGNVVTLVAGSHSFGQAPPSASSAPFALSAFTIQQPGSSSSALVKSPRSVHVVSWQPDKRVVRAASGAETYLVVAQNFNAGWKAKLDGHALKAIRIDGWEQGFIVPAGSSGTVTMVMGPATLYLLLTGLGVLLVLALVVLALWRRDRKADLPTIGQHTIPRYWMLLVLGVAVLFLTAGWLALLLVPAVLVVWRLGDHAAAALAFLALTLAGVFAALNPAEFNTVVPGAFGRPAQICAGVALAAFFAALAVPSEERRLGRHTRASGLGGALAAWLVLGEGGALGEGGPGGEGGAVGGDDTGGGDATGGGDDPRGEVGAGGSETSDRDAAPEETSRSAELRSTGPVFYRPPSAPGFDPDMSFDLPPFKRELERPDD